MSKHTPGPWSSQDREKRVFVPLRSVDCERIGFSVGFVNGHLQQEAAANARLIAAAPDLLEALKRMATIIDKMGDMPDGFIHPSPWQELQCEEALTQARAAIKKAEEA